MLKKMVITLVMAFVLSLFPSAEAQITIVGRNNPTIDVPAVQNAVNQGGDVLLKGTFDFGPEERVTLTRDLKIYGEKNREGVFLTTIKGGYWTFCSLAPSQLPPQIPGPRITIQDIHFEGPLWAPIYLEYSDGATIAGNKMTNIRPRLAGSDRPMFGKQDVYWQQSIAFFPQKYEPGLITGSIKIVENDIDLACEVPEKTLGYGVWIVRTTGATIQVLKNRIINNPRDAICVVDNYRGKDGSGSIEIRANKIVTPTKGIPFPTPQTTNGIVAGWFMDLTGAIDPSRRTKIIVANNKIEAHGENSVGIVVFSDGGIITSNHIVVLGGGPPARGIGQVASDSLIVNNKIEGAGPYGIRVSPFQKLTGSRNILIGNDLSGFRASIADVSVETQDNTLIGNRGKVIDKGQRNIILD
jgi:hypothetical protein